MEQENINSVDASTTTENERRKKELENAANTVIELMGKETEKNWIELYLVIAKVEEEKLYQPEYKSLTAWGTALAQKGQFRLRELWRRKRAGETYRKYENRRKLLGKKFVPLEEANETKGLTPRNLETVSKIAGGDRKIEDQLIDRLTAGKLKKTQLDEMWYAAKEYGVKVRKSRHEPIEEVNDSSNIDMSAHRIVTAIQCANQGDWLPEDRQELPWKKDKYKVYTEVPVYTGSTDTPARIDAVVIETFGCKYKTEAIIHAIEIKVSKSDLEADKKMNEYTDFANYMWLAVPPELKKIAENYIDDAQGEQTWGLLLVETDPENEEDHLVVVRKPKQLAGIMRGDIFEYLVAQYI